MVNLQVYQFVQVVKYRSSGIAFTETQDNYNYATISYWKHNLGGKFGKFVTIKQTQLKSKEFCSRMTIIRSLVPQIYDV
jgi:hypothetical protein